MNENTNLTAENLSSSNLHVDHSPMNFYFYMEISPQTSILNHSYLIWTMLIFIVNT